MVLSESRWLLFSHGGLSHVVSQDVCLNGCFLILIMYLTSRDVIILPHWQASSEGCQVQIVPGQHQGLECHGKYGAGKEA